MMAKRKSAAAETAAAETATAATAGEGLQAVMRVLDAATERVTDIDERLAHLAHDVQQERAEADRARAEVGRARDEDLASRTSDRARLDALEGTVRDLVDLVAALVARAEAAAADPTTALERLSAALPELERWEAALASLYDIARTEERIAEHLARAEERFERALAERERAILAQWNDGFPELVDDVAGRLSGRQKAKLADGMRALARASAVGLNGAEVRTDG